MRKLTTGWVPKSLSGEQMATRASVCSAMLKRFRSKDAFLLCLVTLDILEFIIMSQRIKSRHWVGLVSLRPKKVLDATICWQGDGHSILGRKRRYYV